MSVDLATETAEARNCVQSLREAAAACNSAQASLRTRLLLSAEALQAMTWMATRGIERVEVLEGALRECVHEMEAWDRCEDRTSTTRAAISRARRALELP